MKNITDIINEQQINEESFAYGWQNAFVVAMVQLFLETGEKDCKKILNQWFKDQKTSWELYNFLDRIGAKPDSQNVDDLMRALMRVRITDKFTINTNNLE